MLLRLLLLSWAGAAAGAAWALLNGPWAAHLPKRSSAPVPHTLDLLLGAAAVLLHGAGALTARSWADAAPR